MGWNRVGVNVLGDFSSDVDVAVVTDGVSVFHIKQPRFVSNDFLALRLKTNTRKKERGKDTCPTFPRQAALNVGAEREAKKSG